MNTTITDEVAHHTGTRNGVRFTVGFLAFGLLWSSGLYVVATVLLPQLFKDIGVANPDAAVGTLNSVTAIVGLVSNLVFGNLSDHTRSRFGRRTPWIVAGTVMAAITLALTGLMPTATLIIAMYCLCMVGLNALLAPALAILSDRVPAALCGTVSAFYGGGMVAGQPIGTMIGSRMINHAQVGFAIGAIIMLASGLVALLIWPREASSKGMDLGRLSGHDLLVSFHFPKFSTARDFYRAFGCRVCMLLAYQMISVYQLYIIEDYVHQSKTQAAGTIATMSVITMVVSLTASLTAGPISDRLRTRKAPVIIAALLFALGTAMPWMMPNTTGMFLYAGIAGLGYGVYSSIDQALNVDVLPNKEEAGKDLGILNLATTLGQAVGPTITSIVKTATGSFTPAFAISIIMAVAAAAFVMRIRSVH